MKQLAKNLCLALLLSSPFLKADVDCSTGCNNVKTLFVPISQGSNLYTQYHKVFYQESDDECDWSADLGLNYRYMQTRNEDKISKMILNADCGTLTFQGESTRAGNETNSLVATYFGFAPDSNFSINIKPRIQNHVFDFQFSLGGEKFWFQANAPLTYTKWRLNKDGVPSVTGSLGSDPLQGGDSIIFTSPATTASPYTYSSSNTAVTKDSDIYNYLANNVNTAVNIPGDNVRVNSQIEVNCSDMPSVLKGTTAVSLNNYFQPIVNAVGTKMTIISSEIDSEKTLADGLLGNKHGNIPAFKYTKVDLSCDDTTQWKIADIHLQLGYDFYKHDDKHFGVYLKAVLPTGTKLDDCWNEFIFSPIVGNGNHFELGAGISGHMQLWECDESAFNGYIDAYITHMFKANQTRTCDLDNLPMSRYAVIKKLLPGQSVLPATPSMPTSYAAAVGAGDAYAYQALDILGNVNTVCQDVSVDIRGEAVLDLIYSYKNWELGAGYAFSGKTKEKADCTCVEANTALAYGFLGNAGIMNFTFLGTGAGNDPVAGTYVTAGANGAFAAGTQIYAKTSSSVANSSSGAYSYGSDSDPVPANDANTFNLPSFNRSGLMDGQILHRVFGHVDYVWSDCDWVPQLGVMGSFGFSQDSYRTAEYWDIGARFGISF